MTNNQEKKYVILERFNNEMMWEWIDMNMGEMEEGIHYTIFDTHRDKNKFISFVKETLADETLTEYQIEEIMDTNFVFSDEYTLCSDCNDVIATNEYHKNYFVSENGIFCNTCFQESDDFQENYLEKMINEPTNANQLLSEEQLTGLGFVKLNDDSYESGLHIGQNDSPIEIYDKFNEFFEEILFSVDAINPFEVNFSVWARNQIKERKIG